MSLQKLFNKKVVHLVWISILFSSLLVEPVISADPSYEACKPRKCGSGPNISYPFYVEGARADYCGLHGFKIACQDNKLIYRTFKGPFIIETSRMKTSQFDMSIGMLLMTILLLLATDLPLSSTRTMPTFSSSKDVKHH